VPTELVLRFFAGDPAAQSDLLDALAEVSCRGVAERTLFSIARRNLAAFAANVAALRRGDADLARLVEGGTPPRNGSDFA
jgi:hypothetical protein